MDSKKKALDLVGPNREKVLERMNHVRVAHNLKNAGRTVSEIASEMALPIKSVRFLLDQERPVKRYPLIVRDDTHASVIGGEVVRGEGFLRVTMTLNTRAGADFYMLGAATDLELINAFKIEPIAVDWVADADTTEEVTETSEEVQDFFEEFDPNYNTNNYITDPSEGETPNV